MRLTSFMRIWLTRSFQPFHFTSSYSNRLAFEDLEKLGLYVHIPFCRSLCSFCPYCKVAYDGETARKYKDALIREIELVGETIEKPKEVTSLYFGGGTPALMADDLALIIRRLKKYFRIRGGIGVELHPDDIDERTLDKLKEAGVTMVSVGVQSFDPDCLSAIGRNDRDFAEAFRLIRTAGFDVVDVDLIFALPGQTEQSLLADIEKAFSSGATQVSTYPFIDFTFADNRYKPLPEGVKKKMLGAIAAYCEKTGRERTSVWTFAEKNTGKYSSVTRDNFLGFGVSAATLLKEQFKINTFSIEGYIDRVENNSLPTSLTLNFSLRQRAVYDLFWSAYSMRISPDKFKASFGVLLSKLFGLELWLCRVLGLLKREEGEFHLTNKGAYLYHYIEQAYTTVYIDRMWNVSRNIPFPEKIVLK